MGVSSSVVLKPSEEGLTTRRSSEAGSGWGRAAALVVAPPLVGTGAPSPGCVRLKNMR
jgi:hypothetical protein